MAKEQKKRLHHLRKQNKDTRRGAEEAEQEAEGEGGGSGHGQSRGEAAAGVLEVEDLLVANMGLSELERAGLEALNGPEMSLLSSAFRHKEAVESLF